MRIQSVRRYLHSLAAADRQGAAEMNFEFLKECRLESTELQSMYEALSQNLEKAEWCYWEKPQECGILLRESAQQICRIYNTYYDAGFPEETVLEEFLCYTDNDAHNAMVSRFLSVVRKEQRDRLTKLRVLGDDCVLGEAGPDQGMTFEDRMSQNAKRMMETMMDVTKDMCQKINKRNDVSDEFFFEEALPVRPKETRKEEQAEAAGAKALRKGFFSWLKTRKKDEKDSSGNL